MSISRKDLSRLIIQTLKDFDEYSRSALNLLLGTAAVESEMGLYLYQTHGGPARGIFQQEPKDVFDIWDRYLRYRGKLRFLVGEVTGVFNADEKHLPGNMLFQIVMARVHYRRIPFSLPRHDNIEGLAHYWKSHWNTCEGKGTVEDFISKYNKYVKGA